MIFVLLRSDFFQPKRNGSIDRWPKKWRSSLRYVTYLHAFRIWAEKRWTVIRGNKRRSRDRWEQETLSSQSEIMNYFKLIIYLFGQIQTSQTWGQLYSDTSLSELALLYNILHLWCWRLMSWRTNDPSVTLFKWLVYHAIPVSQVFLLAGPSQDVFLLPHIPLIGQGVV